MTWKSAFVFRFVIGALFVGEYFVGFDGHGRGAGNIITLLFGLVFIGYAIYGFLQMAALKKNVSKPRQ